MLRTENPGSLCACAIGETSLRFIPLCILLILLILLNFHVLGDPAPDFVDFLKKNRVGSRTEINLFTNGFRKAVAMTPSMALLKDMVVHKAAHVFFHAFGATHGG